MPSTEVVIISIAVCPVKRQEIRTRLSNMNWWMRLLCQRIAQRANREEKEAGRFFQDRFRLTLLSDEASLLACSAYVDLNPIRAAMAETLDQSEHTSVQRRIKTLQEENHASAQPLDEVPSAADSRDQLRGSHDSLLIATVDPRTRRPDWPLRERGGPTMQ